MVDRINSGIYLFFFLSFGSIYLFLFGGEFLLLGLFGISIVSFLFQRSYNLKLIKDFGLAICVMGSALLFNWIVTGFSISMVEYPKYVFRIIVVNFAMFVLYNHKAITYKNFEWLFLIVVIHASLNFLFGFIFRPFFIAVSSAESIGYQASSLFYVFFYMANVNIAGIEIYRNQSFFWEPGVLGFVLNLYLVILLLIKKQEKKKDVMLIIIVCILIVTTFSTTALGLMVIQFCIYFFKDRISLKKVMILICSFLILLPVFVSNLKEKAEGSAEGSYIMRYYDSLIALDIIRAHPLFGIGLSSEKYLAEQRKYPRFVSSDLEEGKPNSNSILAAFVSFGIPLAFLLLFCLYKQRIIPKYRKFTFFFFLIFLASEPLLMSMFFIMLMSSAFYKSEGYKQPLNLSN